MSLEYKLEELTRNILLLSAKTEQRNQLSEQNLEFGKEAFQRAETVLEGASQSIKQVTAQVVRENLARPVEELEQRCERLGSRLQSQTDSAQKSYLQTLKTLKILVWSALAAFLLAALACVVLVVFIFQSSKQQIRRAEWVEDINQAVKNGALNQCAAVHPTIKSGLCVKIKDKWMPVK